MEILVIAEGATPEECQRGAEAARRVFDKSGMSPWQAAAGWAALEAWDIKGFVGELSEAEDRASDVWLDAERAAHEACCRDWPPGRARPVSVGLQLIETPLERTGRMRH
jgi:hypothetical protein